MASRGSTKFFHAYAKVRAAKSHISCLRGHLVEDSSVISDHIVSFYKDLFNDANSTQDSNVLFSVIPHLVSDIENTCLTAIPTADEIKSTVFNMDPHSAPGLDGFPGLFF